MRSYSAPIGNTGNGPGVWLRMPTGLRLRTGLIRDRKHVAATAGDDRSALRTEGVMVGALIGTRPV